MQCELNVHGMHCAGCELEIETALTKSKLLRNIKVELGSAKLYFEADAAVDKATLITEINKFISQDGYSVSSEQEIHTIDYRELSIALLIALAVVTIFALLPNLGFGDALVGNVISLPAAFTIGFVASLSSCMAVVGSLVLSISSSYAHNPKTAIVPLIIFHSSRIVSFFILGGIIGLVGSLFSLTREFYLITGIILFVVMFILGMNLLDTFPIFRKFQLRMPKFFGKKATSLEVVENKLAPFLLGAATFFLPCGFTQSMQVTAIATGSFVQGALIMLVFALGTFPVLALISFSSIKFAKSLRSSTLFFKVAGFIILFFAIFNLYSTLIAAGIISPLV